MAREEKKQPKNPKKEERAKFENLLDTLYGAADFEQRFEDARQFIEKELERIGDDGNVKARWNSYLNFIPDASKQEVKAKLEAVRLVAAKLDGSHWGVVGEDLEAMTVKELKEYAAGMKWEGPYPKKKLDLIDAIEERMAGNGDGDGDDD